MVQLSIPLGTFIYIPYIFLKNFLAYEYIFLFILLILITSNN